MIGISSFGVFCDIGYLNLILVKGYLPSAVQETPDRSTLSYRLEKKLSPRDKNKPRRVTRPRRPKGRLDPAIAYLYSSDELRNLLPPPSPIYTRLQLRTLTISSQNPEFRALQEYQRRSGRVG